MKIYTILLLIICPVLLLGLGCDEANEEEFTEVNEWIRSEMEKNYLWSENVPRNSDGSLMPTPYFGGLLDNEDFFSYITKMPENISSENPYRFSSGVSVSFFRFSNSNNVFAVAEFVHPDSPADTAGIKRGDIILRVDDILLNRSNFQSLFYKNSDEVVYSVGQYDPQQNRIIDLNETITVGQGELDLNPVVESKVIESSGVKIGYLFLGQFNTGENDRFNDSLDIALQELKLENITELIIDLRYNRGGDFNAVKNLANAVVPAETAQNQEVFARFRYNDRIQQRIIDNEGATSDSLQIKFSSSSENLDLNRIFVLTTNQTRSTSELFIKGISPYIDVQTIGERTAGELFGTTVILGENANPPNDFGIVPVYVEYVSSESDESFSQFINADIIVNEDLLRAFPVGSESDPFIRKVMIQISGESTSPKLENNFNYSKYESLGNRHLESQGRYWFD